MMHRTGWALFCVPFVERLERRSTSSISQTFYFKRFLSDFIFTQYNSSFLRRHHHPLAAAPATARDEYLRRIDEIALPAMNSLNSEGWMRLLDGREWIEAKWRHMSFIRFLQGFYFRPPPHIKWMLAKWMDCGGGRQRRAVLVFRNYQHKKSDRHWITHMTDDVEPTTINLFTLLLPIVLGRLPLDDDNIYPLRVAKYTL